MYMVCVWVRASVHSPLQSSSGPIPSYFPLCPPGFPVLQCPPRQALETLLKKAQHQEAPIRHWHSEDVHLISYHAFHGS